MTGELYKKWNLDTETDTHKGKMMYRHIGRRQQAKGWQGLLATARVVRGKNGFSPRASRKSIALLTPCFGLLASRIVRQ